MSDRTILNPANANSLNGLFNGSTPISVSTLTVGFPPNDTVLSSNAPDSLIVAGTVTATGGITAQSGVCQLGLGANSVLLTGTTGNVSVGGGVTAFGAQINGTCNATAFGVTNGANAVALQCLSPTVLSVGGSVSSTEVEITNGANSVNLTCTAANTLTLNAGAGSTFVVGGNIQGVSFTGGIVAGTYNIPTSVGGNSGATITFPVTFAPEPDWDVAYAFPQFTLTTSYGIGISSIALSKSSATTLTATLNVYNAFNNAQTVTSVNYLFVYQQP